MAKTVRTCDGDILDSICLMHYGHLNGTVEAALDANPGLASLNQPFQSGVLITLPNLPAPSSDIIQLWS